MFKSKSLNSLDRFNEANSYRNGPVDWYQIKIKTADGETLVTAEVLWTSAAASLFKELAEGATFTIDRRVESYEPV